MSPSISLVPEAVCELNGGVLGICRINPAEQTAKAVLDLLPKEFYGVCAESTRTIVKEHTLLGVHRILQANTDRKQKMDEHHSSS